MNTNKTEQLLAYFLQFVTDNKKQKMNSVLADRTRHVTIMLENLFQPHNASAILRTCDLFGIQDVHVMQGENKFQPITTISMGAAKWLDTHQYTSTAESIAHLRSKGYKIIATTPHTTACDLPDLDFTEKTALLFGTENIGLSQEALNLADGFVKIPMHGFTESFNVSVSVALCLYHARTILTHSSPIPWQLSPQEKTDILLSWARRIVTAPELLEREFAKTNF